jgi:hypothetical protein
VTEATVCEERYSVDRPSAHRACSGAFKGAALRRRKTNTLLSIRIDCSSMALTAALGIMD